MQGNKKVVQEYVKKIDKGEKLDFILLHQKNPVNCHNVTSLVIQFFNSLPESLFTKILEGKFASSIGKYSKINIF